MMKVKYTPADPKTLLYRFLTIGKIYDIIDQSGTNIILLNDKGKRDWFALYSHSLGILDFEDATAEFRSNVIDEILT